MPLLPAKSKKAGPAQVNVADAQSREVVLEFPAFKKLTDAQIAELEIEKGKDVLAICDVTGEPIFNQKNINVINNPDRPEMHEKVISTKVLMKLFEASDKMNGKAKDTKPLAKA